MHVRRDRQISLPDAWALTVIYLALCPSLLGGEIRTVNGKEVNLSPVLEWFKNPQGERPMKHWKRLHFEPDSIKGPASGGIRCRVDIEGEKKEILLEHPPRSVMNLVQESDDTFKALAQIEAKSDTLKKQIQGLENQKPLLDAMNLALVEAQSKAVSNQISDLNDQTEKLRSKLKLIDETYEFAMFTGKTLGKLEIWDCGAKPRL
jgi:hypothetical protein